VDKPPHPCLLSLFPYEKPISASRLSRLSGRRLVAGQGKGLPRDLRVRKSQRKRPDLKWPVDSARLAFEMARREDLVQLPQSLFYGP